ncbi:hypothetical protein nbrc107696_03570 [Gordonia spumicola]|uniref:Uncharacterized protein n=1 Tax=Gordonia spumicola TaxID=589161 RepID=A0A7I9V4I0_9ACTN|nr:hypothetical protein [Gordonia spumicola]GED99910.1 hypothetical protein nbrc107696_03570 [Gordonia spumicola]
MRCNGDFVGTSLVTPVASVVFIAYFVALAARTLVYGHSAGFTPDVWTGMAIAYALLAVATVLVATSATEALTDARAFAVCLTVVAAVAAVWVAAARLHSATLGPFQTMFSTATIVLVVLLFRGRILLAWTAVCANTALGVLLGPITGSPTWLSAVLPRASFTMLFIATGAALLLEPQIRELHALSARRRADRRGVQQVRDDNEARDERIRRIDARVRPLLTKVLSGGPVTDDDVTDARLIEARLRDGIRGRALDVPRVQRAVWDARRNGVSVTVLDDGGLAGLDTSRADAVVDATARVLEDELAGLAGGDVVARIAPPGRDPIATVGVVTATARRRVEIAGDGRIERVVQT